MYYLHRSGFKIIKNDRFRIRRRHDHCPITDYAVLYRSWYGCSNNSNLLYHGSHLCTDPHEQGNRSGDVSSSFLCILPWYCSRYYTAGCPGCLRRCRHRQGTADENGDQRQPACYCGIYCALYHCYESGDVIYQYHHSRGCDDHHYQSDRNLWCGSGSKRFRIPPDEVVGENPVRSWWIDSAHSWNTDRYHWICPGWHCVCSWLSCRRCFPRYRPRS